MNKILEIAFEIGDKIASEQNISLIDASLDTEKSDKFLRLYIDKEPGISLDECEAFSRAFEQEFDKIDPIEGTYTLEVSSPGLDRILKTEREFKYFLGRQVDVKLYSPIDDIKEFKGVLEDYDNGIATIANDEKVYKITTKQTAYIRLSFEF